MARKAENWAPLDVEKARAYVSSLPPNPIAVRSDEPVLPSIESPGSEIAQDYAASFYQEMIDILADIARDPKMPPQTRRGCANDVLTRAFGAPLQRLATVDIKADLNALHLDNLRSRVKTIDVTARRDDDGSDAS